MEITKEITDALLDAAKRETDYWNRHGIGHEESTRLSGFATDAHKAWVKAVEFEHKEMSKYSEGRVFLDAPLARKAFILGYNKGKVG